jgi:phytoene dehydrogenase-like protein
VTDVAVIGAGNGGLAAAALLADAGARVLVAEQHDVPGDFCQCWIREVKHDGATHVFRFDSGVHDISGVRPGGSITSILARLGIDTEIEWARLDHTYRIGSEAIDVPQDWREYAKRQAMGRSMALPKQGVSKEAKVLFPDWSSPGAPTVGQVWRRPLSQEH